MEHNNQDINLEAYLDGELSPAELQAFEAALLTDANLQAELESRQKDQQLFQLALGEDISLEALLAPQAPKVRRRFPISNPIGWAAAACICLVILVPRMLRDDRGAEGPRSQLTISGQVTAFRHGEISGETAMLATGFIELPAGRSH